LNSVHLDLLYPHWKDQYNDVSFQFQYSSYTGLFLNSYVKISEEMLDEKGTRDIEKMKPISYLGNENSYYGLGNKLGNAFSLGKELNPIYLVFMTSL